MDSPVQPGLEVGSVQENEVRVLPPGPVPGSTPEQVVSGFLRAGSASDEEYDVARSYLTTDPEGSWRPDSSIVVYSDESALSVEKLAPDTIRATARVSARIDGAGRFHEVQPGSIVEATFRLQRAGGEWRIASIPEGFGTWLGQSDLDRLYDPFRIYYVSSAERRMVPDVRWFAHGKGLATRLARAQLAPVPGYLAGAVTTEVPEGTRLAVDAVPIDSGVATVDLTATRPTTEPTRRQNLWAQFLATLTQVPGIERVTLKVEGSDLQVPGVETSAGSLVDLGFASPASPPAVMPVLRNGSRLVRIDPQRVGDPGQRGPQQSPGDLPSIAPGWVWLAMSRNGREIAGIGGDRAELSRWRGTTQIRVPYFGNALTKPAYDRHDVLWVGGRDSTGARLWAVNTAADPNDSARTRPQPVEVDWLAGRRVVALSVSPDGQRLALISTDAQGRGVRVDVAGVVREPNGLPKSLAEPMTVAPTLSLAKDLVWVGEETVAVLGRKSAGEVIRPWFVPLGGPIAAGTELVGAQWITTTNGERGLVITTDRSEVFTRAGSRWLPVGEGTDFLVAAR